MSDKDEPISTENKKIAQYVARAFGGEPRVHEYINDSDTLSVGILFCEDRPSKGVTSHSTIKLSDYPRELMKGEHVTRLELAGLCIKPAEFFPNLLATAAFTIMQTDSVYRSGSVLEGVARKYCSQLPHLYLTQPFIWKNRLQTLDCGAKKVSWLMILPISDAEYAYLHEHGDHALEKQLKRHQSDLSNPRRASTI